MTSTRLSLAFIALPLALALVPAPALAVTTNGFDASSTSSNITKSCQKVVLGVTSKDVFAECNKVEDGVVVTPPNQTSFDVVAKLSCLEGWPLWTANVPSDRTDEAVALTDDQLKSAGTNSVGDKYLVTANCGVADMGVELGQRLYNDTSEGKFAFSSSNL